MLKPPFAVVSDIHANLEAMEALHAEIHRQGIRQVVCLGDIVGYGPNPSETTDFVMAHATLVVAGNHDWAVINKPVGFNHVAAEAIEYAHDMMEPKFYHLFGQTKARWHFLENLPQQVEDGDLTFVHGSVRDPLSDYCFGDGHLLWNPRQLGEIFPRIRRVCFCGHTHFPVVIRDDLVCWTPSGAAANLRLEPGRKYVVNVGSVGQPRDGDPRACYAIFTGEEVLFRRVAYDVEGIVRKILEIDALEDRLADRLRTGK
jgi:predicted phosphodiesterase